MLKKLLTLFSKKNEETSLNINEEIPEIEEIPNDFIVHIYNNKPIFIDFFWENDANISFFDSMKDQLQTKKWCELSNEDKCYYLSNKLSYYEGILESKEKEEKELDYLIEDKRTNIQKMSQNIQDKEDSLLNMLKGESINNNIIRKYIDYISK
jgi:hypothetical protein